MGDSLLKSAYEHFTKYQYLKQTVKASPSSVNGALAAADSFFQLLGLGPTKVKREQLLAEAPKVLSKDEQRKLLHAAERTRRPKDRAVILLMLHTGIRISECAALNLDDVYVLGRKRRVIVRSGKGDQNRVIPLSSQASEALQSWLQERSHKFGDKQISEAFFLNPQGGRMTTSALDLIVRKVGHEASLEISAHVLRHNLVTNLMRNDLV